MAGGENKPMSALFDVPVDVDQAPECEVGEDEIKDYRPGESGSHEPVSGVVRSVQGTPPRPPRRPRSEPTPAPASVRVTRPAAARGNAGSDEIDLAALMGRPEWMLEDPDLSSLPRARSTVAEVPDDSGVHFNVDTGTAELYPLGVPGASRK